MRIPAPEDIAETLRTIRGKKPLIYHLTNWVTIYDCAQITRATGALPVMAYARDEVEEMTSLSSALVVNIGTLTPEFIEASSLALKKAEERGIPVVIDAVGAGATGFRTNVVLHLMKSGRISVIKGNAGEIATLSGAQAVVKGVESMSVEGSIEEHARALSIRSGAVVVVTGKVDIVTDGRDIVRVHNGHPLMGEVVGTGCMAASVIGCFLSVSTDVLSGTVSALTAYGIAGEMAGESAATPMEFKQRLMDAVYELDVSALRRTRIQQRKERSRTDIVYDRMNFYFITDRNLSVNGVLQDVKDALEAGARIIQYRDKEVSTEEMYEIGMAIHNLCREYSALYIVNDRLDVALATEADGVHLGQEDIPLEVARKMMPEGVIGVSCATVSQAIEAEKGGADYIGVGPIFSTTTKPDAGNAIGIKVLREIRDRTELPIVAIGGITLRNVEEVIMEGADTVAAISATVGDEVKKMVEMFIGMVEKARKMREGMKSHED